MKQLDQYNNAKLTQSRPNTAAPILHGDMAREDDVNSISMAYASFASEEAGLQTTACYRVELARQLTKSACLSCSLATSMSLMLHLLLRPAAGDRLTQLGSSRS